MPIWVAALVGGLATAAGSIAGRVLLSLGFGFVAYTGIETVLSGLFSAAQSNFSGLPSAAIGVLAVCKVDVAISIISSAIACRLILSGLTSGTIKRLVVKS